MKAKYYLEILIVLKNSKNSTTQENITHSQCCYTLMQLRYLPISLIMIKKIRVGDDEMKVLNFADGTTMFLRDFTCLNRI